MAEKATIFIPDISGFTEFTNEVELDHGAEIIKQLLELIVESNKMDFRLSEIEGDAVLFYLKGNKISSEDLINQCLTTFQHFYKQVKTIQRHAVCHCRACQSAHELTLKFVLHYGDIKEIKVAHFMKATGIDMIIAHRLLKNNIDSNEYILVTDSLKEIIGTHINPDYLEWRKDSMDYKGIGEVAFEYAHLSGYKETLPKPPKLKKHVVEKGKDHLFIEIGAPVKDVYQTLINIGERKTQLMGMTMIYTCLNHSYNISSAEYVEQVEVPDMKLDTINIYNMTSIGELITGLTFNINWKETLLDAPTKEAIREGSKATLEVLKTWCESK